MKDNHEDAMNAVRLDFIQQKREHHDSLLGYDIAFNVDLERCIRVYLTYGLPKTDS